MRTDYAYAQEMDKKDPLARFRAEFVITDPDLIYMDGNSLGRQPKRAIQLIEEMMAQWGDRLIRVWSDRYFYVAQEIGAKVAQLLGAQPDEVIIAESTSVNLFKLLVAGLQAQQGRSTILTDDLNFPSDLYIIDGIIELLGKRHRLQVVPSPDQVFGPADQLAAMMDEDTALVTLTHTVFKSAYTYDMEAINRAAHNAGALTVWDLSHSVGSVPIDLNGSGADMAVGCSYKYVNGGPGAPAFLYVRRDLQDKLKNPITGWMSQRQQFDFDLEYDPLPGIEQFLTGTPQVLSMLPVGAGVDILLEAGMDNLRAKSVQQTSYLIALWETYLKPHGFTLKSPSDPEWRGSHVSLGHPEGWRINQCMIKEMNIIPDFRAPDNIRLGITPLYTTYDEIHRAVTRIEKIMSDRLYEKYPTQKTTVT
ncbi:MAG: kynureninase [Anaerolineales bacterium]|nr:kynureninase [Anaerolineales bacterium]MCB0029000.1 kynureninase [Anaerolineales bacterium]MCB8961958.1 kynureninase [Ardenticatenales bacterium]